MIALLLHCSLQTALTRAAGYRLDYDALPAQALDEGPSAGASPTLPGQPQVDAAERADAAHSPGQVSFGRASHSSLEASESEGSKQPQAKLSGKWASH